MPIGIQRLNARQQQPNPLIIFIKPLPGPSSTLATEYLSRVAAISYPIMKAHHLSVMSLEEYEPNPEFIGRNFNAGEVVQLVLKTRSGAWMRFESVVMVMMHELAHCREMNHGRHFWEVRNGFAKDMKGLWERCYTGEGIWGRGRALISGAFENKGGPVKDEMPRTLCGGTFRRAVRGKRKRKAGDEVKLSYAERQQRRIAKKFGTNGITLGDDEDTRVKLESGKRPKGKPRVAKSVRGRELRAAAALARFETKKEEKEEDVLKREEGESGDETETDYEDAVKTELAFNIDGSKMTDGQGHDMVKVCEGEDPDDIQVKEEMQELQDITDVPLSYNRSNDTVKAEPDEDSTETEEQVSECESRASHPPSALTRLQPINPQAETPSNDKPNLQATACPICSMNNEPSALLCAACSHVLDVRKSPGSWKCQSAACSGGVYLNSADYGLCGVCGARKPD